MDDLSRRHRDYVASVARAITRDSVDAEDVAQDVFLLATRAMARGIRPRYPAAWLRRITVNRCLELDRRARRLPMVSLRDHAAQIHAPLERAVLADLLRRLPRIYRDVLVRKILHGETHAEIAAALGIEVGTSKARLSRARALLRAVA